MQQHRGRQRAVLLGGIMAWSIVLVACIRQTVLYSYQPVDGGWQASDTIRFHIDSIPANDKYTFTIGLRYTDRYPYQDIWLALQICTPTASRTDTIHTRLLETEPRLMEKGVLMHETETYTKTYLLTKGHNIDIAIYSLMNDALLEGITDVGLKVEQDEH